MVQTSKTHTQKPFYLKYMLQYVGYENKLLSTEYEQIIQIKHLHLFMTQVYHSEYNTFCDI